MSASLVAMTQGAAAPRWQWPLELDRYNRDPALAPHELRAPRRLGWQVRRRRGGDGERDEWRMIGRLVQPLDDAMAALRHRPNTQLHRRSAKDAVGLVLQRCAEERAAYWGWPPEAWLRLIGVNQRAFARPGPGWIDGTVRPYVVAYAYLFGGFSDFQLIGPFNRLALTWRVFGREPVEAAIAGITAVLDGWGYRPAAADARLRTVICQALLVNRSPLLADLSDDVLLRLRTDPAMGPWSRSPLHGVHRALAALGHATPPPQPNHGRPQKVEGAAAVWMGWVNRWYATSTLTPTVRRNFRGILAKVGRWIAAERPDADEPATWTRELCAAWLARLDRLAIGDYAQRRAGLTRRVGRPLAPRSKAGYITVIRTFFRDCQEWGWIRRRFDPSLALATPNSIQALIGPQPRVIADDIWAKLLWAGLNLEPNDLLDQRGYPIELVRALTLTWLFSGQRSDEIARLRVGCARWQGDDTRSENGICMLDIPTHKTGAAFTKPVDPIVGKAIEAWQAVRPAQPSMADRKTGEQADFLFAYRARPVAKAYINQTIIPLLCRKAGVPDADVRGRITSHRARSTIASQLYNAKEPMTLFELQAWLGHRSPETTQHYAQITPTTLTKAYNDAGYFARNVRTIEVLVDRQAVQSGAASSDEPWQYYDLGHGYCSYTFFEQCQHRMACARCDFYVPKESTKEQLLEARDGLQRMLALIPLTDEEHAAVDADVQALDRLVDRLADVPTPAGPTPRELAQRSSLAQPKKSPAA